MDINDSYIKAVSDNIKAVADYMQTTTDHTLEIKFMSKRAALEGKVTASFTRMSGNHNVRISYYNSNNEKCDTMSLRNMQPEAVASHILSFIHCKEIEINASLDELETFRNKLNDELSTIGYTRDCDSKFMSAFTGKLRLEFRYNNIKSFIMYAQAKRRTKNSLPFKIKDSVVLNNITKVTELVKKLESIVK